MVLTLEEQELPEFQEIMAEAKEKISGLYPLWTNYNPADSGMAILELFAYMTELQQFHAGQFGPSHKLAFLNLLGTAPRGLVPARVYAENRGFGKPFFLLAGTKTLVGGLVWEAEKTIFMDSNAQLEGVEFPFYPFGETPEFLSVYELGLKGKLSNGCIYTLYFDLADDYPVKRNPIREDVFLPLVRLRLEFYDGTKYQNCEVIEDGTFGLLKTGFVRFTLPEEIKEQDGKYKLRLCIAGEYDTAPLLNGISFHMAPFVQKDTKIESNEYALIPDGPDFYEALADSWYAVFGETKAYKKEGEGFRRLYRYSSYFAEGMRRFVFEADELGDMEKLPEVRLVSRGQNQPAELVFEADGCPNQEFFLPDKNILGSCFSLWVEEKKDYFVPWRRVVDFAEAGSGERCYCLDEQHGILKFGDGLQGRTPSGKIEITGYALCEGRAGNMQKNQTFAFMDETGHGVLWNPRPGIGGKNPETIEECVMRYREEKRKLERAVTERDYEELIRQTPGLRIKKVRAFPSPEQENCLEAVVQPYTNGNRKLGTDACRRNIIRFLEKKKLLGTQIIVREPEYIGIMIQLEFVAEIHFLEAQKAVEKAVWNYFDTHMDFGHSVDYSQLYGYIDSLPETAGIYELSMHARGRGTVKGESGDIKIPPHGIACLEGLKLQCISLK